MSTFDEASLVFIPSGYKTSKAYSVKPTDGSGDLAFTRSNDTATRVGPDGLIEKVRTNLILQSAGFSTASWDKVTATVSANTTANPLDGTVNADTITLGAGTTQKFVAQVISLNGNYTVSVYLKAGTHQYAQILLGTDSNAYANFDLSNGTLGTTLGVTAQIVSAGNGWYRCSMAFSTTTADSVFILAIDSPSAFRYSTTSSTGTMIAFGYQVETGDIATSYIATTTAAVSVGPVANVPRLDYLNSSCPRLLLEPQRTNLATYSEQFNNAAWVLDGDGAGQSVTANYAISPDGYQNADRIQLNKTGGTYSRIRQLFTAAYSGATTFSVYLKTNDATTKTAYLRINGSTSTLITITGSWTRFSITDNWIFSLGFAAELFLDTGSSTTADISAYGAQVEAGAYATSYIPTLGAAVTRGADAAVKTSATALIGQTEGTLYAEFDVTLGVDGGEYFLSDGTNVIAIQFPAASPNTIRAIIYNGGGFPVLMDYTYSTAGSHKVAYAYKANDFVLYVDGVQRASDTSGTVPACSIVQFGGAQDVASALVFKTRLSNADLAALTA